MAGCGWQAANARKLRSAREAKTVQKQLSDHSRQSRSYFMVQTMPEAKVAAAATKTGSWKLTFGILWGLPQFRLERVFF
jgi:hypothetical protein